MHTGLLILWSVGLWPVLSAAAATGAQVPATNAVTLVAPGSLWKYLDDGEDPGTSWRTPAFDDGSWKSGAAPLGYGDGDEATVVSYGADPARKRLTTYFRTRFNLEDPFSLKVLTLRLWRDDGAVVYLNGTEVLRDNMPEGPLDARSPALRELQGEEERAFVQRGVWPGHLLTNENVLAVEIHQASPATDDCRLDVEFMANLPLTRPTVTIVTPTDGSVLSVEALTIAAAASDLDGHIERVAFYAGLTLLGMDDRPPFSLVWSSPAPGRYPIQVEAMDNSGRRDESEVVHVQIGTVWGARLMRGPYLQSASPSNMVICWRTDWFEDARVEYGTNHGDLEQSVLVAERRIEHAVRLTGLIPETKYYYAVGTSQGRLAGGWDCFFWTPPARAKPTRIWVIGDSGKANENAEWVRDVYSDYADGRYTDIWLMLGDNAYEEGTDAQYQAAVFDMYETLLRQTVLWPTLGNHDDPVFSEDPPYLSIFNLPTRGEAGGLASGTENYYAFNYGNIHFVCLDSHASDRHPGSPMLTWLEEDLAAAEQDWILAFFHHAPYTFGTHNSDREGDLAEIRKNILPILEAYGVDLVLTGHSHVYERSYLLQGHYGYSTNLAPGMILDAGAGREEEDGAYEKPAGGLGAGQGTVYAVCGCSGEGGGFRIERHPAMCVSLTGFGSIVVDIDGDRLDARFLWNGGYLADHFTIRKGLPPEGIRPPLRIEQAGPEPQMSWWTSRVPFRLESTPALGESNAWVVVTNQVGQAGRRHTVRWTADDRMRLFRLRAD